MSTIGDGFSVTVNGSRRTAEQRAASSEQRAESREQRAESSEQVPGDWSQGAQSQVPESRRAGEPQNRRAAVRSSQFAVRRNSTKYRVEIKGKTTFCSSEKYTKKRPNSCKKCLTLEARFGTITKLAQSGYIALKREIAQK